MELISTPLHLIYYLAILYLSKLTWIYLLKRVCEIRSINIYLMLEFVYVAISDKVNLRTACIALLKLVDSQTLLIVRLVFAGT